MSQEVAKNKKVITGTVVSNKMDKTVVVSVESRFIHPTFKKVVKRTKKFKCHDEKNECSVGDFISMREVRPLSKTKRWNLDKVLKTAQAV
ncbi:MAG TPA: 30S ribosomal protein S17 [Desulfobacteria bacterium]|nr:30S ribosomal protein S17 [Desulfobacteria bacterium]